MPIAAKHQAITLDDKLSKVIAIISTMRNQADADFIRNFVGDICQRYINKQKELDKYTSPSIQAMDHFEIEYIERILKEISQC